VGLGSLFPIHLGVGNSGDITSEARVIREEVMKIGGSIGSSIAATKASSACSSSSSSSDDVNSHGWERKEAAAGGDGRSKRIGTKRIESEELGS
jgi:hypothetical protein